jgi:hypothetical protein
MCDEDDVMQHSFIPSVGITMYSQLHEITFLVTSLTNLCVVSLPTWVIGCIAQEDRDSRNAST